MVPLVLYGLWFSDALHFATVAEEATIEPAFDATAYLGHDYQHSGASASSIYGRISHNVQQDVQSELATSYDSYDTGASPVQSSVFVRPKSLQLSCQPSNGNGGPPRDSYGSSATDVDATLGRGSGYLQTKTWITCSAAVNLDSSLFPHQYRQDQAHVALFPSSRDTLQICGVGPGLWGCPRGQGDGFSILLDDWAVEKGDANKLKVGSASGNTAWAVDTLSGRIALAQAGMRKPETAVISSAVPAMIQRSRCQRMGSASPWQPNDQWAQRS